MCQMCLQVGWAGLSFVTVHVRTKSENKLCKSFSLLTSCSAKRLDLYNSITIQPRTQGHGWVPTRAPEPINTGTLRGTRLIMILLMFGEPRFRVCDIG